MASLTDPLQSHPLSLSPLLSYPQCALASEMGLLYGAFAMSTDYDAWREGEEVTVAAVLETMRKNSGNVTKALTAVVPKIGKMDWTAQIAHVTYSGPVCAVCGPHSFEHMFV